MSLFRRMGRQLPDLPPVRPLQRDPDMPPRPQQRTEPGRRPPEYAEQQQPGYVYGGPSFRPYDGHLDPAEDPCGRPGPKITITAREGVA